MDIICLPNFIMHVQKCKSEGEVSLVPPSQSTIKETMQHSYLVSFNLIAKSDSQIKTAPNHNEDFPCHSTHHVVFATCILHSLGDL